MKLVNDRSGNVGRDWLDLERLSQFAVGVFSPWQPESCKRHSVDCSPIYSLPLLLLGSNEPMTITTHQLRLVCDLIDRDETDTKSTYRSTLSPFVSTSYPPEP